MLDIGWSELALVAVLALVIIGPKDLPGVMRTIGQWTRKARGITREFQSSIDEMVREAELEDARKAIDSAKSVSVDRVLDETIDPTGSVKEEVRDLEQAAREDPNAGEKSIASAADAPGPAEAAEPKAEVVEHPAQIAPPHSLTPPEPLPEAGDTAPEKAASGGKGA